MGCKIIDDIEITSGADYEERLFHCAKIGDLESIKCIGEHRGFKFSPYPLLKIAAENGNTQLVEYLIARGAWIDYPNLIELGRQETALYFAVKGGHIETAMSLMQLGAKTDIVNLLSIASDPEMIRFLMLEVLEIDDSGIKTNPSIELLKVCRNDINMPVECLLKVGANINYRDEHGFTPLAYAIQNDNIEAARSLINLGAKTDLEIDGKDLLTFAVESSGSYRDKGMIVFVWQEVLGMGKATNAHDPRPSIALHKAVSLGLYNCVKELISDIDADIEYKSTDGSTPLVAATRNRHNQVVDVLIELGANVNVELDGRNLMDIAIEMEDFKLIDLFAKKGLTSKQIDARQFASSKDIREHFRSIHAVKWLVANGANVDIGIDENDTALCRAIDEHNIEMLQTLIELGARIDIVTGDKNLLDIAINTPNPPELIEVLLDAGLESERPMNPENIRLIWALRNAAQLGKSRVVKYLVSVGANVNPDQNKEPPSTGRFRRLFSKQEIPPLFEAVRWGRIETASLLIELGAKTNIEVNEEDLLDNAIKSASCEMIDMVLKYGFDIDGLNPKGRPYLATAMLNKLEGAVDILFKKEVNYWICSEPDKRNALWFCSSAYNTHNRRGWSMGCQILMKYVRDTVGFMGSLIFVNHQDYLGQTALHFYSENGDYRLVDSLLRWGADPNIRDNNLNRPHDLAKTSNIKRLLLRQEGICL